MRDATMLNATSMTGIRIGSQVEYSLILFISVIVFLTIASYLDFKKREVEDWLNYGFLFFAFFYNALLSIVTLDYMILIYSLIGFGVAYLISLLLFYTNQWGGGDAKAFISLGALLGLPMNFNAFNIARYHHLRWDLLFTHTHSIITTNFIALNNSNIIQIYSLPLLIQFLVNLFIVGGIFAVGWSFYIAFKSKKNKKKLMKSFKELYQKHNREKYLIWSISIFIVVASIVFIKNYYPKLILVGLGVLIFFLYYLMIFIKVVENKFMIKDVDVSKLTEGDWIVEDVFINKKYICGPKDNGISKEQIEKLLKLKKEGKIKKVKIKEGMPFIPSFLIAFVVTILIPNWFILTNLF